MTNQKSISLADLNVTKKCEDGFEFEYIDEMGKESGIFLTVLGAHAEAPRKRIFDRIDREARQNELLKKRGKDAIVKPINEIVEMNIEDIASFIVGWRGITEPWSAENAVKLCEINPLIVEQVKAASETLANFTRSK
jgi:hypothetical protein